MLLQTCQDLYRKLDLECTDELLSGLNIPPMKDGANQRLVWMHPNLTLQKIEQGFEVVMGRKALVIYRPLESYNQPSRQLMSAFRLSDMLQSGRSSEPHRSKGYGFWVNDDINPGLADRYPTALRKILDAPITLEEYLVQVLLQLVEGKIGRYDTTTAMICASSMIKFEPRLIPVVFWHYFTTGEEGWTSLCVDFIESSNSEGIRTFRAQKILEMGKRFCGSGVAV